MNEDKKIEINNRIVNNIYHLCKLKNIKIGDLEKKIGVRIGYFSRKKKSYSTIGIFELIETTEILEICLDEIINVDYKEQYLKIELQEELEEIEKRKQEIIDELKHLN